MKKHILDRYERDPDGRVIVDVSASRVEELYEDFDKTAPYHKKDLDDDLAFYLTECAREIGRAEFVIRFAFDAMPPHELRERVRTSLHKFFMYQRELEIASMKKMLRTSMVFFLLGISLLFLSLWSSSAWLHTLDNLFMRRVLVEGVTIAAWVSLWESLATFLVNWRPFRQKITLNYRIASAKVLFQDAGSHR
jgi:hypothetical protein